MRYIRFVVRVYWLFQGQSAVVKVVNGSVGSRVRGALAAPGRRHVGCAHRAVAGWMVVTLGVALEMLDMTPWYERQS